MPALTSPNPISATHRNRPSSPNWSPGRPVRGAPRGGRGWERLGPRPPVPPEPSPRSRRPEAPARHRGQLLPNCPREWGAGAAGSLRPPPRVSPPPRGPGRPPGDGIPGEGRGAGGEALGPEDRPGRGAQREWSALQTLGGSAVTGGGSRERSRPREEGLGTPQPGFPSRAGSRVGWGWQPFHPKLAGGGRAGS